MTSQYSANTTAHISVNKCANLLNCNEYIDRMHLKYTKYITIHYIV